jgi:4-hydroxythreonine-4-phosphate dehydrogenase
MAWLDRASGSGSDTPPFVLIDDPDAVASRAHRMGRSVHIAALDHPGEASGAFADALPVLPHRFATEDRPGELDPANGSAVAGAIERAVDLIRKGLGSAVVTNPIQKETLYQAGFKYPGHTEYLAALAGTGFKPVMLLVAPELRPQLRVVPVTIHVPLSSVSGLLTTSLIVETARITARALALDFGIERPRLAISGLNPHAGEGGTLGAEDGEIIAPAVDQLRAEGMDVFGPAPADTLFHAEARETYDVVLGMYHDQVLVPIKTLDIWGGVNVTIGLPFIRTSPDHGTAVGLAGTGRAKPDSLVAALKLAAQMVKRRAHAERAA